MIAYLRCLDATSCCAVDEVARTRQRNSSDKLAMCMEDSNG